MSKRNSSIKLSPSQFLAIIEDVLGVKRQYIDWLKVERPIKKKIADVQAIRVYLPELKKEIDQTIEKGEYPRFLVKRTTRAKTGEPEIELVFMGSQRERHTEDLSYWSKPPEDWSTWGLIVLTPEQALRLIEALKAMIAF